MKTKTDIDIAHVVKLAHLDIAPEDQQQFLETMQDTLNFMKQLDKLNLEGVSPSAYAFQQQQYLRDDVVSEEDNLNLEENAPVWEENAFRVPKIIDSEAT